MTAPTFLADLPAPAGPRATLLERDLARALRARDELASALRDALSVIESHYGAGHEAVGRGRRALVLPRLTA